MNLGARLKILRNEIGLSQEAMGSQGFVSTPGWIKVENGQRLASSKLIDKLIKWLVAQKHIKPSAGEVLCKEVLTLKYLGSKAPFLRQLAREYAETLPNALALLRKESKVKPKRGRPKEVDDAAKSRAPSPVRSLPLGNSLLITKFLVIAEAAKRAFRQTNDLPVS